MKDVDGIYEWLKGCPELYNLWVGCSLVGNKRKILQSSGTANMYEVTADDYCDGGKKYLFKPTEPYYFDIDIICYEAFYADETELNLDNQNELQDVCNWLIKQQNIGAVPFSGCYQIECLTPRPFMRGTYYEDGDANTVLADYAVTVRFYTDNPAVQRTVIR